MLIILLFFCYLSNLCKVTVNIIMYKSFLVFLCIIGGYGILPYPRSHPTTEIEKQEGVRIAERKAAWVWQDAIPS